MLLRNEADTFQPRSLSSVELTLSPKKPARRSVMAALGVVGVLLGITLFVAGSDGTPLGGEAKPRSVYIHLAGYVSTTGGQVPAALQRHIDCMRTAGFDLPDPIQAQAGWVLRIDDPKALGLGSRSWEKAAFDTCALVRDRGTYDRWIRDAVTQPGSRSR
jgi:hypothetical protein